MKAGLSKAPRPRPASPTSSSTAAHTAEPEISAQVYWPLECLEPPGCGSSSCVSWVVGWNVHKFTFCVAALVPQTHYPLIQDVEAVLGEMWRDPWLGGLSSYSHNYDTHANANAYGKSSMGHGHGDGDGSETHEGGGGGHMVMVLGECHVSTSSTTTTPIMPTAMGTGTGGSSSSEGGPGVWVWGQRGGRAQSTIWLQLQLSLPCTNSPHTSPRDITRDTDTEGEAGAEGPRLQLLALHCCGCPYRCVPGTFVLYERSLSSRSGHFLLPPSPSPSPPPQHSHKGRRAQEGPKDQEGTQDKQQHSGKTRHSTNTTGVLGGGVVGVQGLKGVGFDVTLHHINSAHTLHTHLQRRLSSRRVHRPSSSPCPCPPSPPPLHDYANGYGYGYGWALPACVLGAALTLLHSTAQTLSVLVGPPSSSSSSSSSSSCLRPLPPGLRVTSLALSHISSRLRRYHALPQQARLLFHHRARHPPAHTLSTPTLTLQGRVVCVIVDVCVGVCVGLLLTVHAEQALATLHPLAPPLHVKWLSGQVEWLKHYPGGFKLNGPLTQRLGTLVLTVLECHCALLSLLLPTHVHKPALHALAALGLLGGSVLCAACLDVLRVLTWHTDVALALLARLYYLQLALLASLWRLFRGKKVNVLRRRIDSLSACHVSTPQLLLGSMLGTVLTCLFPTMALFYAFFAALQCLVLLVQCVVWLVFVLLCDLPMHRLSLLLSDPHRLPAPVTLSIIHLPSPSPSPSSDDPLSSSSSSSSSLSLSQSSRHPSSSSSSDPPPSIDDSHTDTPPPDAPLHSEEPAAVSPLRRPPQTPHTHRRGSAVLRLQGCVQGLGALVVDYAHTLNCLAKTIDTTPGRVLGAVLSGALVADPTKGGQVWLLQRKSLAQVLTEVSMLSAAQQDAREAEALERLGPLLPPPTPQEEAAASASARGVDVLVLCLALLLLLAGAALLLGVTAIYRTHQLQNGTGTTIGYNHTASIEL